MNKTTGLLREWGRFQEKTMDFSDEYGDSVLHKYSKYGCSTSGPLPGSSILCADQPSNIQAIGIIVSRLPKLEREAVTAYFCCPLKEDGNPFTIRDLSKVLRMSCRMFEDQLKAGRGRVHLMLTGA